MAEVVQRLEDADAGLLSFKAFGVPMYVAANRREALERLSEVLPPDWQPCEGGEAQHRLAILGDEHGTYGVDLGGTYLLEGVPLDLALTAMTDVVEARLALHAPDRIFVHAGVVAHEGKAVLLPGQSFAGKTSLVAALVRAGAVYYSDEFAPLDMDGLVFPYAKPLSIRDDRHVQIDHEVESLGGTAGHGPLRVGAVVATYYRRGAEWAPEELSPGKGVLAVLAHTVPARERPSEALQAVTRAVEGAVVLQGERGEADELAPVLLAELEARVA